MLHSYSWWDLTCLVFDLDNQKCRKKKQHSDRDDRLQRHNQGCKGFGTLFL